MHDGVHQHPVVGKFPEGLRQDGQRRGSYQAAPDVAKTAQHHNTSTRIEVLKLNLAAWREE